MHNVNPATDYFETTNNCTNERNDNCNPTLKWVGVGGKCPQTKLAELHRDKKTVNFQTLPKKKHKIMQNLFWRIISTKPKNQFL